MKAPPGPLYRQQGFQSNGELLQEDVLANDLNAMLDKTNTAQHVDDVWRMVFRGASPWALYSKLETQVRRVYPGKGREEDSRRTYYEAPTVAQQSIGIGSICCLPLAVLRQWFIDFQRATPATLGRTDEVRCLQEGRRSDLVRHYYDDKSSKASVARATGLDLKCCSFAAACCWFVTAAAAAATAAAAAAWWSAAWWSAAAACLVVCCCCCLVLCCCCCLWLSCQALWSLLMVLRIAIPLVLLILTAHKNAKPHPKVPVIHHPHHLHQPIPKRHVEKNPYGGS